MICWSRLASVKIDFGSRGSNRIRNSDALGLGDVPERPLDVAVQVVQPQLAGVHHHRARLDLRQVEDVVDEHQQVVARTSGSSWRTPSACGSGCRRGSCDSWSDRMSRLLSGVRSSWHMFARNSDLYLRRQGELLGLLFQRLPGLLDLLVLPLDFLVLVGQQAGLLLQLLVGVLQLLLPGLELLGERLGLLEQALRPHVGLDRVEHDADRLGELVEERLVGRVEPARTRPVRARPRPAPRR